MRIGTAFLAAMAAFVLGFSVPLSAQEPAGQQGETGGQASGQPQMAAPEAAAPSETNPDAVVATIDGAAITEADLALAASELDAQFSQLPPAQQRAAALSALLDIKMLARKAEQADIADEAAFERRMAFLRDRTLHNLYFQDAIADAVGEDDVAARYEEEVAAAEPQQEIRARHILLDSEEAARQVIAALEEGADFAALAEERSTGPSASSGGDLGYFRQGQMVPAFEEAASALEPGEVSSEPVQSQFGWHVIKVEDKREAAPPPLEQIAEQIRQVLLRERYFEALQAAREEFDVEIADPALRAVIDQVNASR